MRHALFLVLAAGAAALLCGAPARSAGNPACDKIEEPLAYNACLARFGPRAPAMRAAGGSDEEGEAAPRAGAHEDGGLTRRGHGRVRAVFGIGGQRRP